MIKTKYYKFISSDNNEYSINLKEIWDYKDLVFLLVKKDFVSRYKQTILGPAWAVIQPLLTTVVFTFIFGNVANLADCGSVPTFLFYMCGNISWNLFAGCLTGTANTFIANRGTMGKVYFPRLCVPIATTLSQLIGFGIQSIMFIIFLVIYLFIPGYVFSPNLYVLMVPVLIAQMVILGMGVGIIISSCTTKYRDLQFLVGFGVSLWMYATPVAYSLNLFKGSILYQLCRFNPMSPIIEMIRYAFLGTEAGTIDWTAYIVSWLITLMLLVFGVGIFNKVEKTFMDTV